MAAGWANRPGSPSRLSQSSPIIAAIEALTAEVSVKRRRPMYGRRSTELIAGHAVPSAPRAMTRRAPLRPPPERASRPPTPSAARRATSANRPASAAQTTGSPRMPCECQFATPDCCTSCSTPAVSSIARRARQRGSSVRGLMSSATSPAAAQHCGLARTRQPCAVPWPSLPHALRPGPRQRRVERRIRR